MMGWLFNRPKTITLEEVGREMAARQRRAPPPQNLTADELRFYELEGKIGDAWFGEVPGILAVEFLTLQDRIAALEAKQGGE